jgi:membrane peptidoglycan carboxypeptidase
MAQKRPRIYKTRGGHSPRARVHASWSPIGQRQRRQTVVRLLGVLLGLVLVGAVAADAYAEQFLQTLPSVHGLDASTFTGDTVITDRNGVVLADVGEHGNHRLVVRLKDVSPKLIQATISIEDKNFYKNQGFDIEGIIRSALNNYKAGTVTGGGSTITQQLAKQLFLTPEQTYSRKFKELILAYELSQAYTKDQILELYLNNTYYGSQSYGIQAAAQSYFHVDAKNLDLAQAAILAGLPQAPTEWNPILHPEAAKVRQQEVLTAMERAGYITHEESAKAYSENLVYNPPVNSFLAPHFVDYVQEELRQLGFRPGLQQLYVKSTLDNHQQQIGEQVVRDNLAKNLYRDRGGQLSSGLIAMDPKTGEILTMVGSPDYNARGGQYNWTTTPRNPGSSIKPFMYGAVIAARVATMETPIYDGPSPLVIPQPGGPDYKVYNYDHGTHGTLPLKQTLGNSLNIPAVKAELSIGVPAVLTYMRNLGLFPQSNGDPNAPLQNYGPSLTLGGYPTRMIDQVTALSVYADMGVYHPAEAILQVTDSKGTVLYKANPDANKRQAIDPGVAFIMGAIMSDNNNRVKIFGPNSPLHFTDRTIAAKTGTTDDFKDALTMGFTPDLASVIWVGDILDINHTLARGSDGVFVAAPGWHAFMAGALAGVPDKWFSPPADVVRASNNDWFLKDSQGAPKLPNDSQPSPTPAPPTYAIPSDPGTGPVMVLPSPCVSPTQGAHC